MTQCLPFILAAVLATATACRAGDPFEAMNRGDVEGLAKMLAADATLANKAKNGDLPLHYALRGNNFKIVKLLVDAGVDVNAFDDNGFTPLDWLERGGPSVDRQAVRRLLCRRRS